MHHQLPEPTANPCWQQGLTQGLSPSGTVHEEAEPGPQEEFHKHLYSQPAECTLPLSDQVSAEALWTVLREQSKLQLMKMDNEWTMNTQVFQHMKHKRSSLDTSPGSIPARMESNTELLRFLKNKKQGNTEAQQKVWEGTAVGTITHPRLQRAVDLQHGVQEAAHLSMPATGKASKLLKEKKLAPQRLDGVART
ncbi:UNVERIFIED_CONTAM: hypothetical protein FKN15_074852 [Acipenser sinensis]